MVVACGAFNNSEQFHFAPLALGVGFQWQYPNQRGNDSAFQAKRHTFRQTKKTTIKVQIYSACVTTIIITSSPIYAQPEQILTHFINYFIPHLWIQLHPNPKQHRFHSNQQISKKEKGGEDFRTESNQIK